MTVWERIEYLVDPGTCFFRHAELAQLGVPVCGDLRDEPRRRRGRQWDEPERILRRGRGGGTDRGDAALQVGSPGSVKIHYDETGFFRAIFEMEMQVLDAIKAYMADIPAYNPRFFRVAAPAEPKYAPAEILFLVPVNTKAVYDFDNVLAWLVDNSEHMEFRPGYGPEVYTGLVKVDGFLMGVIGNQARMAAGSHKGPWALSNMKPLKIAMSNCFFAERGYLGLLDQSQALGKTA